VSAMSAPAAARECSSARVVATATRCKGRTLAQRPTRFTCSQQRLRICKREAAATASSGARLASASNEQRHLATRARRERGQLRTAWLQFMLQLRWTATCTAWRSDKPPVTNSNASSRPARKPRPARIASARPDMANGSGLHNTRAAACGCPCCTGEHPGSCGPCQGLRASGICWLCYDGIVLRFA